MKKNSAANNVTEKTGSNSLTYVLIALLMMVVSVILSIVTVILIVPKSSAKLDNEGKEILQRTIELLDLNVDEDKVFTRISSGSFSVGDYVAASLVSSDYLLQSKDDEAFAKDLSYILYGTNGSEEKDIVDDLDGTSRIYVIDKYISSISSKYALSSKKIDEKGSQINSCTITKPLSGDTDYTIGIRQVEGEFDITGEEVRTDFYVDGALYQATIKMEPGSDFFTVSWDTSGVEEGLHDVQLLLRSSDGRGYVIEGGNVLIPHCMEIANGGVSNGNIVNGKDDAWYALFVDEGDAYVNFVNLDGDIGVTLYDIYGEKIGSNDLKNSSYEVLRGKAQDMNEVEEKTGIYGLRSVYYIHAYRSLNLSEGEEYSTDNLISYKMIQTPNVARYDGQYYAVKDCSFALPTPIPVTGHEDNLSENDVTLIDVNGNETVMKMGDVTFLPINGFLNSLNITNVATGNSLITTPQFSSTELYYGYFYNSGIDTIKFEAEALEGYASSISITNGTSVINPGETLDLAYGENVIEISVNSFAGYSKTYKLYILQGDDKGDYVENTLSKFPVSYYDGLWLLHNMHPNYIFKAYNTGLDYYTVLDNEDNKDKNLASYYSHPGWTVESSPVYDGGGWKQAKYDVVNYFLDPRNFLTPKNIFSFELLSFEPSAQTVEGVRSMIKGSFMDTTDPDYAQIIYDAGKTANVSPYFLASRILQEMGYQGQSLLCHGTLPGYEGYYNFYNIGSTPDPSIENGALINGAKYAMWGRDPEGQTITEEEASLMLPWNSVERAITGGALWIASRYTAAGQDTLYFQKFDVIDNEDGLYIHQYAQNISMAYTEGARYFDSYASIGMVDQGFIFLIPVYDNMPSFYGYLPDPY